MIFLKLLCWLTVVWRMPFNVEAIVNSPVNGHHLVISLGPLPPYLMVERNASGDVIEIKGAVVPIMEWLSQNLGFSYSIGEQIKSIEDGLGRKGFISLIKEKKTDMFLGTMTFNVERHEFLDFPYPWDGSEFALMIPAQQIKMSGKLAVEFEPFQFQVWILIVISIISTIIALISLSKHISIHSGKYNNGGDSKTLKGFNKIGHVTDYVLGVTLSQGRTCLNQNLAIRILAGAWCLTCFVLVTAYSSILISYVTAPSYEHPIVDSVYDLPNRPEVKLTVDRGWSPDVLFSNSEEGIGKFLGEMLRSNPKLKCNKTPDCVDQVRGGFSVYAQGYHVILNLVGEEFKRMNRCEFTVAKDKFMFRVAGFALAKNSPYTDDFSIELLKMEAAGMLNFWRKQFAADPSRCLNNKNSYAKKEGTKPRLGIIHLSGAFVLLVAGFIISGITFIFEYFLFKCLF